MNCAEANQIDLVNYLHYAGHQPKKIIGNDYWYYSPLRNENTPSFKVNKNKNVWYDHGLGRGGKLVDFVMEFHHINVRDALQKIVSFHVQKSTKNYPENPLFHHQKNVFNNTEAGETAIKIIAAKQPIQDLSLCRYLVKRGIEKGVADRYCHEMHFTNTNKEKIYRAIGFKNNAGGYELRNEYFKGSCSPKWVTYIDNKSDRLTVFEGFFDFLSYQSMLQNQQQMLSSFLILNSLSYFERSLLLMGKYDSIHLYLDNDNAGRKCSKIAQKRSQKFINESKLYRGYKDLNDWKINYGKILKNRDAKQSINISKFK